MTYRLFFFNANTGNAIKIFNAGDASMPEKHIIIFGGLTVNKMNHLNNFAFQKKWL